MITEETVTNDRRLMEKYLADAKRFAEYSGCELYCGEFGVIDCAPEQEAVKWLRDFTTICNEMKIGHAMQIALPPLISQLLSQFLHDVK